MSAQKPQPRTILTEDGELQQMDDMPESTPDTQLSAVYCTNCGTANPETSHFCRSCGQSLEEQVINPARLDRYAPPMQKGKRDAAALGNSPQGQTVQTPAQIAAMVILDIVSLLIMGGLVVWTVSAGQGIVAVFMIIAWLIIESQRHHWNRK